MRILRLILGDLKIGAGMMFNKITTHMYIWTVRLLLALLHWLILYKDIIATSKSGNVSYAVAAFIRWQPPSMRTPNRLNIWITHFGLDPTELKICGETPTKEMLGYHE